MINFYCIQPSNGCRVQCRTCIEKNYYNINPLKEKEVMENELLNEIENQKPKFKLNPIGVYFVGSLICVIWKAVDLVIYVIHLF